MNPLREKFEYFLARGYFTVLRCLSEAVIYGACNLVASIFYGMGTQRRRITHRNLLIAFPEKTQKEREQIARAAYRHFGRMIAESAMVLSGKSNREKLLAMVDDDDVKKLLELEASTEKGILFLTGHLGNFEFLAHYTGLKFKRQAYVVARKGANQLIDDRIVTPMRESFGNEVVYKSRALPRVALALKKGGHAGLLIDIKANEKQGAPVHFFGKETFGIKSSAYLQIKLNPLVVPITLVRGESGRYKLIVGDPVDWSDNGQPVEEQIAELTQLHQNKLEELIRAYPNQWLWMHNRWRLK